MRPPCCWVVGKGAPDSSGGSQEFGLRHWRLRAIPTVRGGVSLQFDRPFPDALTRRPCVLFGDGLSRSSAHLDPAAPPRAGEPAPPGARRTHTRECGRPLRPGGADTPVRLSPRPPAHLHPEDGLDSQRHVSASSLARYGSVWKGFSQSRRLLLPTNEH